ncbi:TRAP transporter large permease subunit [Chloroflexota bacterium]
MPNRKATIVLYRWVAGLDMGTYSVIIAVLVVYAILGCFLPSMPMLMLTLPVTFPLALNLGIDPVLFGILLVTMCEMGAVTPPMGLNLFVVHGIASDIPFMDICKGALPFIVLDGVRALLILFFPQIALAIPYTMRSFGR